LKINKPNAFHAISAFSVRKKLHREDIERQLIWNKVVDPSSYISNFNKQSKSTQAAGLLPELTSSECAEKRCHFHYKRSQRIGQRVYITEISSEGLVAATVVGRCQTLVKVVIQRELDQPDLEYF
jgi:hypothetical protein